MSQYKEIAGDVVRAMARVSAQAQSSWWRMGAIAGSYYMLDYTDVARNALPPRNALPEPIDVADHIGNVGLSMIGSSIPALVVAGAMNFFPRQFSTKTVCRAAWATGMLVATTANALSETKFGQRLIGLDALPDYTPNQSVADFIWGVGAAALALGVAIRPGALPVTRRSARHTSVTY